MQLNKGDVMIFKRDLMHSGGVNGSQHPLLCVSAAHQTSSNLDQLQEQCKIMRVLDWKDGKESKENL